MFVSSFPAASSMPLYVAATGAWFQLGHGSRVELTNRPTLQRVLAFLAGRERASVEEIFAAAWVGERAVSRRVAANRVYVAIHALRGMGLDAILNRGRRGYVLDATIMVVDETRQAPEAPVSSAA